MAACAQLLTKKYVYFAMRDVLLDAPVYWQLEKTTVFGFYPTPDVDIVIPWEKLGLYLDPVAGKFSLIGSKVYKEKMNAAGGAGESAKGDMILKPDEHQFVLALDKATSKWFIAVPRRSIVRIDHLPAFTKEKHPCARVPYPEHAWVKKSQRCYLGHGDIVKVKWAIDPRPACRPEELTFAFLDEADPVDLPPPALFDLPRNSLEDIFGLMTPRQFLDTFALTLPYLPGNLEHVVRWKSVKLSFDFDSLRVVRVTYPAGVITLEAKVAPPTGNRSAAPERQEFQEWFHRLLGVNLKTLHVWDADFLADAPKMPNLKTVKIYVYDSEGKPASERLRCLTESPVDRLEIEAASGLHGRGVMVTLPGLTKIALSFLYQREFWISMTREQLRRVTHLSVDPRSPSSNQFSVPVWLMDNLRALHIERPFSPEALRWGTHPQLRTLVVTLHRAVDFTIRNSSFWKTLATSAPNLVHLKVTCREFEDCYSVDFFDSLRKLEFLTLIGGSVSLRGIQNLVNFFPGIRYMRVETFNIVKDLQVDAFAGLRKRGRVSLIWKPTDSTDRCDLTFIFTTFSDEETKKAEGVFKF